VAWMARPLDQTLSSSLSLLGIDAWIEQVVLPLLRFIDEQWSAGRLSIAQEHLASASLRNALDIARRSILVPRNARKMIVTTPVGQLHELGAMLVAISATRLGWQVIYLGPNLPAAEIVTAAKAGKASAIALSIVHPEADPKVEIELLQLRAALGPDFPILVGGRAAASYGRAIAMIRGLHLQDFRELADLA
jgi:MerR family transcriptional regulator, light-induced transcriptional regulator